MSLYADLQKSKSEEDVKDAYIKALGLKSFTKGLIDIQTKEVWFEAKVTSKWTLYEMFTQLLHYVQVALNKGEDVPAFLCVVDVEKAAIMRSADVIPFLAKKTIKWGRSATSYTQAALDAISAHIGTHFVAFRIETDGTEFVSTLKAAIKSGEIVRTQITPDNLKQVFDKWVEMIGREIKDVAEDDYNLLFFADVMHDGKVATHKDLPAQLLFRSGEPVFELDGKNYGLESSIGYQRFWTLYDRPPKAEYRNYLLERRDSLIPLNERTFKGAFYTPLEVVDKAYDLLTYRLGKSWQSKYKVWDMCCGVGNLEVKHANHRNLFMSTLDQSDVDVMKATKTCVAAHRFQYDYLNDDIAADGTIDYSLTNKLPAELRAAIAGKERMLVLINPPYAEAMNAGTGVASTKVADTMTTTGYASRELYVQFLSRIQRELPNAVIGMFSTLKYVNAPNFDSFRKTWRPTFLDGFVVHSKAFDGINGNFPIGFLLWNTGKKRKDALEIETEVLDRFANPIGAKRFYEVPKERLLNNWIERSKPNRIPAVPLRNALEPTDRTTDVRGRWWADDAIGGMICNGSDIQHAGETVIFSSTYGAAGGYLITKDNLRKSAMVFTVRRIIKPTWLNNRDQLKIPDSEPGEQFANDCLLWMLFNNRNLAAGADDLEWAGKKWSLVNNFIPFTEAEVGSADRFESDFMSKYLARLKISAEAKAVKAEGRKIWSAFHAARDDKATRTAFKLNRADVGWYQIRNALKARTAAGSTVSVSFAAFDAAYEALTDKILPQVYSLGFLRA